MRRYILIAAVAGMTVQPLTPLPLPVKQTGRDRVLGMVGRIASTGCAVDADAPFASVGVWGPPTIQSSNRGPLEEARQRNRAMHDRCVPRRECFTSQGRARTSRDADSRVRTPTFLGR